MRTGPGLDGAVTCEVWLATPSGRRTLPALLDDAERLRAGRLRQPADRARFVTARALLRLVLAGRTGTAPSAHRLDTTCARCGSDHGKPRLVGAGERVHFSIAHSVDLVVVAVADGAAVGVDVEPVSEHRAQEMLVLSDSVLGPAELDDYRQLPSQDRGRALAVWWTRKEAVLKSTGAGLTVPMRDVAVTAPGEPAALRETGGSGRPAMATLRDLALGDGHVGCVAALGSGLVVVQRDGDELLAGAAPPRSATMLP